MRTLFNSLATAGLLCVLSVTCHAITVDAFINEWNGKTCGSGQCVALAQQWVAENHWPSLGNYPAAKDYAGRSIAGYVWVGNQASNKPQDGDIVVFNAWNGNPYGHIAIAYHPTDMTNLTTFDQNWTYANRCSVVLHQYYRYVAGWYHKQ